MRSFSRHNDRAEAHYYFDLLWKDGVMSRTEAYDWLSNALNLTTKEAHSSRLSTSKCMQLIECAVEHLNSQGATTVVVSKYYGERVQQREQSQLRRLVRNGRE
jgi:hypothetical protein